MASDFVRDSKEETPAAEASTLRYMARQPILDRSGNVHGYELLFRDGLTNSFQGDLEKAVVATVDNAVVFGLEYLTFGRSAFINCSSKTLTEQLPRILPPAITVLEVLETVEPTPELIQACRKQF